MKPFVQLLLAAVVAFPVTAAARADIAIGTAGPLEGQYAAFGEQLRRGVQRAVDDINATGGIRGERLVLRVADDRCDPRRAVEVATEFVSQGVKFVAGHYCSGSSIPASKVYEQAGIVQISPASTNPKFTDEGGWNVLRVCNRDDAQGSFAAAYFARNFRGRKIALVADRTPYGQALAVKFRETLSAAGLPPAIDETYAAGGKDYGDLALKLRDAFVDAVYLAGGYPEAGLIARELRGLGSPAQFVSGDALVTDEFWAIAKEAGEGTLMTFAPDVAKRHSAVEAVVEFQQDGFTPEGYTLHAYAAVQAWAAAAAATGGSDGTRIAQWLRAGNRVNTVLGEIFFDAKGDVRDPVFAWFRWSDGKYAEDPSVE